jgi:hypothetical protein
MYNEFISTFEGKINQLSFIQIVRIASSQIKGALAAVVPRPPESRVLMVSFF